MTFYVNCQSDRYHETVDEFDSFAEAQKKKDEYQHFDYGRAFYYVSKVPRPTWNLFKV